MKDSKRGETRASLIRAAERLFAEKGLAGVSVRDITVAAGARNQSALHYHFGGMEELIRQVFANRFHDIEDERLRRLAAISEAGQDRNVHALIEAGIAPLLEACLEEEGRLYARFCAQLMSDPRYDLATLIKDVEMKSVDSVRVHLSQAVESVPDTMLLLRMRRVFMISVMIMADYARQVEAGNALPVEEAIEEATQSLVGFLLA